MTGRLLAGLALFLTGCPGAVLLGAALHEPDHGRVHPPNAADYAAWAGTPKPQLETHRQFSLLPKQVKLISDGSEMWVLRRCPAKVKPSLEECCLFEFVLASGVVTSYRSVGQCQVDCSTWPESKVQGCINDTLVPEGYGRSK